MGPVACIDVGTVTVRLAVADVDVPSSKVTRMLKRSTICNMGEGLSATGRIGDAARGRVVGCVDAYLQIARSVGAAACCCTLTSAARDATNSDVLVGDLERRGLHPQVIAGEVEGSLTFLGVAQDFVGERLLVADNGGGSTELAVGALRGQGGGAGAQPAPAPLLDLECVRSTDVGCRRMTERFLSAGDPPTEADIAAARAFADGLLAPVLAEERIAEQPPERLVVTGGTATSLVAIHKRLDPYDPAQVHRATLSRADVDALTGLLSSRTVEERAQLKGLQPQRAPLILAGAIAISELMLLSGASAYTASESDLLFGLAVCAARTTVGLPCPIAWTPLPADLR